MDEGDRISTPSLEELELVHRVMRMHEAFARPSIHKDLRDDAEPSEPSGRWALPRSHRGKRPRR